MLLAKAAENCPSEENLPEENTYKNLVGTSTDININEMPFVIEEKGKMESAEKQIKKYNNSLLLEKAAEFCPSDENPSEENTYKNLVGTCTDINVNELPFVIEEKSKMEPNAFYTEYKVKYTRLLKAFEKKGNNVKHLKRQIFARMN